MSVGRISLWAVAFLAVGGGGFFAARPYLMPRETKLPVHDVPPPSEDGEELTTLSVATTHPQTGALERVAVIPGSIQAYQHVNLFSKVSGFLKNQSVDIGDRVKEKQVLAEIDIPELDKLVQKNQ